MDINEIKEILKTKLKPKRYIHTLGVLKMAEELAKRFNADYKKAQLAGLLHDCAKDIDIKEQIKLCKNNGIELDELTMNCPLIIHAPLGAKLAELYYGIEDKEILSAIAYHTTGKGKMTKLEKIIYLADMIEENRDFEGVKKIRSLAKTDLDEAVKEATRYSIEYNLKMDRLIHTNTLNLWNDIKLG